jgi:hypothetical protein
VKNESIWTHEFLPSPFDPGRLLILGDVAEDHHPGTIPDPFGATVGTFEGGSAVERSFAINLAFGDKEITSVSAIGANLIIR